VSWHRALSSAPQILTVIAAGNLFALFFALIAQHLWSMLPCAWCIVQRIDVILLLLTSLVGALLARVAPRAAPGLSALCMLGLAGGGLWSAWHQHSVAAKQLSCAFTWADRTLMRLALDTRWPDMFQVQATCADAAQSRLLGLPFELWSAAWFAVVLALAVRTLHLAVQPRSKIPERQVGSDRHRVHG